MVMRSGTPLTEKEKGRRQFLIDKYNAAKTRPSKMRWYAELMDFEEEMLRIGHNG